MKSKLTMESKIKAKTIEEKRRKCSQSKRNNRKHGYFSTNICNRVQNKSRRKRKVKKEVYL